MGPVDDDIFCFKYVFTGNSTFFYNHYFVHETIRNDITRCRFRVCGAARVQFATGSIMYLIICVLW